jgi:hypothetical protein
MRASLFKLTPLQSATDVDAVLRANAHLLRLCVYEQRGHGGADGKRAFFSKVFTPSLAAQVLAAFTRVTAASGLSFQPAGDFFAYVDVQFSNKKTADGSQRVFL